MRATHLDDVSEPLEDELAVAVDVSERVDVRVDVPDELCVRVPEMVPDIEGVDVGVPLKLEVDVSERVGVCEPVRLAVKPALGLPESDGNGVRYKGIVDGVASGDAPDSTGASQHEAVSTWVHA